MNDSVKKLPSAVLLLCLALLPSAARAQFTRQQIHYLIDQNEGAEARAQYIYHYFKKDRDPNLKPPKWIDDVQGEIIPRTVWQHP